MAIPNLDILIKCSTLLYREKELIDNGIDNSKDLVKTILSMYKDTNGRALIGGESSITEDLKKLVIGMVNNNDEYDKATLLDSLSLILRDKPTTYQAVEKALNNELTQSGMKRSVLSLRNNLTNYYKKEQLISLINKSAYQVNRGLEDISTEDFASQLITNLEALSVTSKIKDPSIINEIDVGNENEVGDIMGKVKKTSLSTTKLKTGWKEINNMTGGGFRRGEFCTVYALQHKYKSGFVQSLFLQLPRHNVPVLTATGKKPLIVLFSFEDDATVIGKFMYNYLYHNENNILPDLNSVTDTEIASYIKERVSVNGYSVKLLRIDPTEWSIRHMFNKLLEYEANGYEIHGVLLDYLAKLPTIGCINSGPGGTDVRDMFNRVRNFASSHDFFCVSPHQISTEGKQLIRNGVNELNFVKEINGKGYSELSKQIEQVSDLEFYIHKASLNRKWVLTVQLGKHRGADILDDEKKYAILHFPKNAPIKETIYDAEDIGDVGDNAKTLDDFDI